MSRPTDLAQDTATFERLINRHRDGYVLRWSAGGGSTQRLILVKQAANRADFQEFQKGMNDLGVTYKPMKVKTFIKKGDDEITACLEKFAEMKLEDNPPAAAAPGDVVASLADAVSIVAKWKTELDLTAATTPAADVCGGTTIATTVLKPWDGRSGDANGVAGGSRLHIDLRSNNVNFRPLQADLEPVRPDDAVRSMLSRDVSRVVHDALVALQFRDPRTGVDNDRLIHGASQHNYEFWVSNNHQPRPEIITDIAHRIAYEANAAETLFTRATETVAEKKEFPHDCNDESELFLYATEIRSSDGAFRIWRLDLSGIIHWCRNRNRQVPIPPVPAPPGVAGVPGAGGGGTGAGT